MKAIRCCVVLISILIGASASFAEQEKNADAHMGTTVETGQPEVLRLGLDECIDIALKNNRRRPASQFAVEIAEAQHKQALSAYWPRLMLRSSYTQLDEEPNFIFPEETATYTISGLAPVPMEATVTVPEKDIKLMDRETVVSSLDLTYPIYTGGLRGAVVEQAKQGIAAAKEASRRTDLQVVYDVKRMYYAALLSRRLHEIGREVLAQMEVTLELTENLYKTGSGTVMKTDYLQNKVAVEGVRSAIALLETNEEVAKAALVNSMGVPWQTAIEPLDHEIPFAPSDVDLTALVSASFAFNPDWAQLEAGLKAAEAGIKEARSGHFPKIALMGNLTRVDNSYDAGIVTSENKNAWAVGVGLELPLFEGFLTENKIKEARARLKKLEQEKILLREGIALQVKHIYLQMVGAQKQERAAEQARTAAEENRDLNVRAYQQALVETQDVIQAQLLEAFMKAQHEKALYDHAEAQVHLDFVVGTEVVRFLEGNA